MNNIDSILPRLSAADPDRVRAARLADKKGRESLLWIYAFHLELAKVPELVSEPMIGDIRYQWWREAIDEIYQGVAVRAHEVTTPLARVLRDMDIPRFWCDRLIDGRSRDLNPTPFEGIDEARDYCRQTSGVLMQIAAKTQSADVEDETVLLAGEAWGLTGLCRAYPYYHTSMLSGVDFETLVDAAKTSFDQARMQKIPAQILPACAYAALVPKYLTKMSKDGFDPLKNTITLNPFVKQVRQFKTVVFGRI